MSDDWSSGPSGAPSWASPEPAARVAPFQGPPSGVPTPAAATCYRHNGRAAPVTCARCDKGICTDCMVSAAVGWQCPGCAKDGTTVRRLADLDGAASANPPVTMVLIGISVAVFLLGAVLGGDPLGNGSPRVIGDLGVYAAAVDAGEWWRIFTSGFLHFGPIHLGFNMLMLWRLGSFLERRWGAVRFFALFTAALVGGSAGALILSPGTLTGGASGAIFGLMGAAFVCRGTDGSRDPMEASLGGLLVMNLVITFALSNYISVGGHLGGLLVGGLIGVAIRFDRSKHRVVGLGASIGLGAAALIVGLVVASAPLRG